MDVPVRKRFDDFVIDVRSGELRRRDAVVPLQRQPALALAWLVAHAGQLVTRDELRAAIWPSDTHVDFDHGLNYCIRQVRLALESVTCPRCRAAIMLRHVPRRGRYTTSFTRAVGCQL